MSRMDEQARIVIAGVDTHADSHQAAVLDEHGKLLGTQSFAADSRGYQQLLDWISQHGQIRVVGVEGTGSYGAGLTRHLRRHNVEVIDINRPHRHMRSRRGKTDAVDAEGAARHVLSGQCTTVPKDTTGIVEAIRQLYLVRASAVQARTIAKHQLGTLAITAPAEVREQLTAKTLKGKAKQCLNWTADDCDLALPANAARTALHSLAIRIQQLHKEIKLLDQQLSTLVTTVAPSTTAQTGIGTIHAAQLLITAGQNISRLNHEAALAHLCAAGPIPASSGKTQRHRLNPGGDRAANRALHMIAVVRMRYCPRTRAYTQRRTAEGKSKKEILRCLKRYIAREVYHNLIQDLGSYAQTLDGV